MGRTRFRPTIRFWLLATAIVAFWLFIVLQGWAYQRSSSWESSSP